MHADKIRACMLAEPSPTFLLPFVMRGGKTAENGCMSWTDSICHRISAVCPHSSFGQWLVLWCTILSEPFQNPKNFKRWVMIPIWPGNSARENLTYQQQHDCINKYLQKELGFYVRKVTHIFRVLSA